MERGKFQEFFASSASYSRKFAQDSHTRKCFPKKRTGPQARKKNLPVTSRGTSLISVTFDKSDPYVFLSHSSKVDIATRRHFELPLRLRSCPFLFLPASCSVSPSAERTDVLHHYFHLGNLNLDPLIYLIGIKRNR